MALGLGLRESGPTKPGCVLLSDKSSPNIGVIDPRGAIAGVPD